MTQNSSTKHKKNLSLILAYCKVGIIGFGGGSALIPVIEKETVKGLKAVSEEEYTKHTVIANITPGTLPTKLGALSSPDTSVAAAYGVSLPGVLLTILLLSFITLLGDNALDYISYASIGIITFIIFLLAEYIHKVIKGGKTVQERRLFILIAIGAFILTAGKEIRGLLGVLLGSENDTLLSPIIDIASIDLMIATFFIICFLGNSKSLLRKILAIVMPILYFSASSKATLLALPVLYLQIGMLILAVGAIVYDCRNSISLERLKSRKKISLSRVTKKILLSIAIFFVLIVILLGASLLLEKAPENASFLSVMDFAIKSIIATCTSFGGGEAFISIADGTFVESGYISTGTFYSQVVPVANALPGPILVKILAGIGYGFGTEHFSSPAFGWLLAMLATAIGIGCSSILALIVMLGFDSLKDSIRLNMIKKYILPVVCGMLITTSVSMIKEMFVVFSEHLGGRGINYGYILCISLYLLIIYGIKKLHLPDIIVLASAALISLATMLILV